ncbi:MAG: hypothetical protein IJ882_03580, partial [Paludibacteraceae bacterium]|nr:hypothetical protein [Paludibacteraceae bacterium]
SSIHLIFISFQAIRNIRYLQNSQSREKAAFLNEKKKATPQRMWYNGSDQTTIKPQQTKELLIK